MRLNMSCIWRWISLRKAWGYQFAVGVAVGYLVLLTHGHHVAESLVLQVFKMLAGVPGTVLMAIFIVIMLPVSWLWKRNRSSEQRHAALRGNRRRVVLERLGLWVADRNTGTAFFVAGIAFVALVHDDLLAGFRIATDALWFYALATFIQSVAGGEQKFARYSTGISLGYLVGISFAPFVHHL